jgi:hypothetical protein
MLREEGIPHECKDILRPHPGKFKREGSDFVLTLTGETIDVKTVADHYKIRLLVREDQFRAKRYDVYVGQRAEDETQIECWGYVTGQELATVVPSSKFGYGPCRHWLLKDLHSIDDFIRRAKEGMRIKRARTEWCGPRYCLEGGFREKLFKKAIEKEGGETHLGRKLGYAINFGFRARQLRRGEVRLSERQLWTLSSVTGISKDEILKHAE